MFAAFCAACCAANGVPLRDPRKPSDPELFQLTVLPCVSAMVTMVLLNVAWIWTIPKGTFLRSFFLKVFPVRLPFFSVAPAPAAGLAIFFLIPFQTNYVLDAAFFLFATVPLRGPLRVRAFVCVRCPRTGKLRRWRYPRYEPILISRLVWMG